MSKASSIEWHHMQFQEEGDDVTWTEPVRDFNALPSAGAPGYLPSRAVRCTLDGRTVRGGEVLELALVAERWALIRFIAPAGTKGRPQAELMLAGSYDRGDPSIIWLPATARFRWPTTADATGFSVTTTS